MNLSSFEDKANFTVQRTGKATVSDNSLNCACDSLVDKLVINNTNGINEGESHLRRTF